MLLAREHLQWFDCKYIIIQHIPYLKVPSLDKTGKKVPSLDKTGK
jgi:hypothetical protein